MGHIWKIMFMEQDLPFKKKFFLYVLFHVTKLKKPKELFYISNLMYPFNIGHNLAIATESIYEYVTFYHQILNFSALKSKLFEVSKTKELPEAVSSVTSFPVGNHRIQLNIHSHKNPSQKPSQIGKSHSDGGSYP